MSMWFVCLGFCGSCGVYGFVGFVLVPEEVNILLICGGFVGVLWGVCEFL